MAVEVVLKDGSTVSDARLGRLPEFDEISKEPKYRAVRGIEDRPYRSYTYSTPQHLDQGRQGSCTGHRAAHELIARYASTKGVTQSDAVRLYLYSQEFCDEWEGGEYANASPIYSGSSNLGVCKAVIDLYPNDIAGFEHCFGIKDVLLTLSYKGGVGVGINWRRGMSQPDENGFIHNEGVLDGGHSVWVKGQKLVFMERKVAKTWEHLDTLRSYVKIHQSWGKGHGDGGDVYLSVGELDALLREDGDAQRFLRK